MYLGANIGYDLDSAVIAPRPRTESTPFYPAHKSFPSACTAASPIVVHLSLSVLPRFSYLSCPIFPSIHVLPMAKGHMRLTREKKFLQNEGLMTRQSLSRNTTARSGTAR